MLRYLYNNKIVSEPALAADLTLLDYLREHKQLTGTKEGCASGDCGACTVVVADCVVNAAGVQELQYRSVNSCITFAGALHGKQLITVESLQNNKVLHPSQQSMVDCHASQCGFCTPGFVMSLFSAMKNNTEELNSKNQRAFIDEQLGGNLCRCTGYRPIIDAAESALAQSSESDKFSNNEAATIAALSEMAESTENTAANNNGFLVPKTVAELCQLKVDNPNAVLLAGGTDLALRVTQNLESLEQIISLSEIKELTFFTVETDAIKIGAGLTLNEFRQSILAHCPELEELLIRYGGTQVRNQATVGGNFANASPVGDLPPVFIALNASVVLQSIRGQRTVSAAEFFISYKITALEADEFIREFTIPLDAFEPSAYEPSDRKLRVINKFYKISKRLDDDISAVCAAFHLVVEGDKVVQVSTGFGGMAEIPKPAKALEESLVGSQLNADTIKAAQAALHQDFTPIADVRASAEYRMQVCENLITRLVTEINAPEIATRISAHDS